MHNLVLGATGFVGSALVTELLLHGETVTAFLRPESDAQIYRGRSVRIVRGDITDIAALRTAMQGIDRVYHAAGLHTFGDSEERHLAINVLGTRNVMRAAAEAGVKRVVFTSSESTVGSAGVHTAADETGLWDLGALNIPYLTSKYLAEVEAIRAAAQGLDVVCVNPSTVLGDGDRQPTPIGRWIIEFLNGRLPAVPPLDLNVVDVADVARGHWLAAEQGRRGERYILGAWNTTMGELLAKCGELVGRHAPMVIPHEMAFAGATVGGIVLEFLGLQSTITPSWAKFARKRMHVSHQKAARELGYTITPLAETLDRAIRWFNASGMVKRRL